MGRRIPGVIDIGTNSVRLALAEIRGGRPVYGLDVGHVTRLGAGLVRQGAIDPEDESRTADALERLVARAQEQGATEIRIVGTEVFRAASNGAAVAARLGGRVGLPVQILSGDEEAAASFRGALSSLPPAEGFRAVMDIGGGSTEVIFGDAREILFSRSLPVGALRVMGAFVHADPCEAAELAAARGGLEHAFDELAPMRARLDEASEWVGVGGSVCALAAYGGGITPYDPDQVQGLVVSSDVVAAAIGEWSRQPLAERMARGGLSEGRARVVLGGALVVEALMSQLGLFQFRASVRGLRHGLLEEPAGS